MAIARKEQLAARKQARLEKDQKELIEQDRVVEDYLQALSPEDRIRAEMEALTHATIFERRLMAGGGSASAAAKKTAIKSHILKLQRNRDV